MEELGIPVVRSRPNGGSRNHFGEKAKAKLYFFGAQMHLYVIISCDWWVLKPMLKAFAIDHYYLQLAINDR